MIFDKSDIPFLIIVFLSFAFLLYTNYQHNQKIEEKLKEVLDYNFTVIVRQARTEDQLNKISVEIDSLRALYLRK